MKSGSPRSLRRAYVEWVEERIEEYKDRVPRGELLSLADEVVNQLRVSEDGQYQLTELLLCQAVDRRIMRRLKLPGYRTWAQQRLREQEAAQHVIPLNLERMPLPLAHPGPRPADAESAPEAERRLMAVVG